MFAYVVALVALGRRKPVRWAREHKEQRGMSLRDVNNWLGAYPGEFTPEDVRSFLHGRDFSGSGCDEYVFRHTHREVMMCA